jgi:hypothetical protein
VQNGVKDTPDMHTAEQYLQKAAEMDAKAQGCTSLWEKEAYRRIARRLRASAAGFDAHLGPASPPADGQSSSDLAV